MTEILIALFVGAGIGALLQESLDKKLAWKEIDKLVNQEVEDFKREWVARQENPVVIESAPAEVEDLEDQTDETAEEDSSPVELSEDSEPETLVRRLDYDFDEDVVQLSPSCTALKQTDGRWTVTAPMVYETDIETPEEVIEFLEEVERMEGDDFTQREPEVVPTDFLTATRPEFSKVYWNYNSDGVLWDDVESEVENPSEFVGEALSKFGEMEDDPNIVGVRNYALRTDIIIVREV